MKLTVLPQGMIKVLQIVAALTIGNGSVAAQTTDQDATVNEITVEAPRSIPRQFDRHDPGGGVNTVMTFKTTVRYADLDLTKEADAARLLIRVDFAARYACKQLDRLYPLDPDANCLERAITNATPRAKAAIAAAGSPPGNRPAGTEP